MPHLQIQSSTTARLTLACLSIPGTMATTELPAVSNDAAKPPAVELEQTSELPKELGAIQFHVGADVVKRDIVKKTVSKDSQAEAWQYYLGKRPVQNELTGIPFGFKTNEDGTAVLCAEADGKPLHDWKSLAAVPLSEFADLGTGIKLTFDFMWHTSVFFGIMWLLGKEEVRNFLRRWRQICSDFLWRLCFLLRASGWSSRQIHKRWEN